MRFMYFQMVDVILNKDGDHELLSHDEVYLFLPPKTPIAVQEHPLTHLACCVMIGATNDRDKGFIVEGEIEDVLNKITSYFKGY